MTTLGQRDVTADLANDFEGFRTNRVYPLMATAPSVAHLVEHPWVLALLERLLRPNYLLSANLAINLWPGETAQQLHHHDGFYPIPRPRPAISVSTVWAVDDFTPDNGATEIVPGSHHWGDEPPADDDPRIVAVEMPPGSVVVFAGTLWHGGGANRTDAPRLAISPQYCEPWARQQETQMVAVGQTAATYSDRIRALLGYSIHPPFMGHIDGLHPLHRRSRRRSRPVLPLRPRGGAVSWRSVSVLWPAAHVHAGCRSPVSSRMGTDHVPESAGLARGTGSTHQSRCSVTTPSPRHQSDHDSSTKSLIPAVSDGGMNW
jgi:ectoine hydroxylase-related dioxygenase (phytanoyl-CoA dioxygenase family)